MLNKFETDLSAKLFILVLTGIARSYIQAELAKTVLKLSSKQPDVPTIRKQGWVEYWAIHVVMLMNLIASKCPGRCQGHKNCIEGSVEWTDSVQKQSYLHLRCQQYLSCHLSG